RSEQFIWEQVLDQLLSRIPEQGADAALKIFDTLLLFFGQMRDEAARLDQKAIKDDRRRLAELKALIDLPFHDVTISVYFDSLIELMRQAFTGIQTAYQVIIEQAIADLGAGKGDKNLNLAKDRLERLRVLVDPQEEKKKSGGVTVKVTKSEFKKGGGKHLDIFLKGKAARKRSVDIEFYDAEMFESMASEKEMDFGRILAVRREQIQVVERIYGLERDKQGKPTTETQENAAAIPKLGKKGLRLDNDDDWRRFLLEKYEEHKKSSSPAEAFTSVIRLLEAFLHTFTTHTPYNIADFGDNVLTKQFPRALTGQLIHDC